MPRLRNTLTECGSAPPQGTLALGLAAGHSAQLETYTLIFVCPLYFQALGEVQSRPQIAEPRLLAGKVRTCQCVCVNKTCPGSGPPVCRVLTPPHAVENPVPFVLPHSCVCISWGFLPKLEDWDWKRRGGDTEAGKAPKSVGTKCQVGNSPAPSPKPWAPRQPAYCS